ncbi:MAG TPA: tripartite tricarboxylate transporter permease [Chloroflexota bacterium]|nr:tripartite tricarboxylate transporter permease [Chloroflexota bacterium]
MDGSPLGQALQVLSAPQSLLLLGIGVLMGYVFGALPGLSMPMAVALALPFTYFMSLESALVLLTAVYTGGLFGGVITSILFNIPGESFQVAVMWDGNPLARAGRAGEALTGAVVAYGVGGGVSLLFAVVCAPLIARIATWFSPYELFGLILFGLCSAAGFSHGSRLNSLISLLLGLLLATVGVDQVYGQPRFTFGVPLLRDGVEFLSVLIGLYAIGEVLQAVGQKTPLMQMGAASLGGARAVRQALRAWPTLARGLLVGMGVGIHPGSGAATVASFLAYSVEKQVGRHGKELGSGRLEGVLAPQVAATATEGAGLIPLLTLGIPASAAGAIMLAAFMLHGVQPGPALFTGASAIPPVIFGAMFLALALTVLITVAGLRVFLGLLRLPEAFLYPLIVVFSYLGAYGTRNNLGDVWIATLFGLLGYLMARFSFPVPPLVLGLVLGPFAEHYLLTAWSLSMGDLTPFVTRPISLLFLVLASATLVVPLVGDLRRRGVATITPASTPGPE